MHNMNTHFADVTWTAHDVQGLRPDWTEQECINFLENNYKLIRDELIIRGHDIIENLLEQEDIERLDNKDQ